MASGCLVTDWDHRHILLRDGDWLLGEVEAWEMPSIGSVVGDDTLVGRRHEEGRTPAGRLPLGSAPTLQRRCLFSNIEIIWRWLLVTK